ncbi:MAG: hypothetical protein ACYTHK_20535 [Planctomycetota bacterium]|jgi:hypothetical protein
MTLLAIELNDAGIRAARSTEDEPVPVDGTHLASPGYAWLQKKSVITGVAAQQQAAEQPLGVDNRFWDRLDTEPVDPRIPRSPNRAEVAFAHLRHVMQAARKHGEDVVLAVPAFYERRELEILVGIARELKLPLKGLVASAIAIDPGAIDPGAYLLVDLTLYRASLSVVELGETVLLRHARVAPDVGVLAMRRQWVKTIGAEFVRKTRFDPLHDAVTEQRLHDRLPALLDALARDGSDRVELEAGTRAHHVTVTSDMLEQSAHGLVFGLCRDVQSVMAAHPLSAILLSGEAMRVPGLQRVLQRQVPVPVRGLEPGAAALGLSRFWPDRFDQSLSEGVAYHASRTPGAAHMTTTS